MSSFRRCYSGFIRITVLKILIICSTAVPWSFAQTHHNVTYLIIQWLAWLWTETFNFVVEDSKYIILDISIRTRDHISKIAFPISSSWFVDKTIITSTIHMNSVFSQFSNTMTSFYNVLSGQLPVHFRSISGKLVSGTPVSRATFSFFKISSTRREWLAKVFCMFDFQLTTEKEKSLIKEQFLNVKFKVKFLAWNVL